MARVGATGVAGVLTKANNMLSASDLNGVYAIMPTPSTAEGSNCGSDRTVDLEGTRALSEALVQAGVDGIVINGTTGECPTLLWEEQLLFTDQVLATVGGRVPVVAGVAALGTRHAIRQVRELHSMGAAAFLLGLPMWQPATDQVAVGFYEDIAEALPDSSLIVYANPRAFRYPFGASFWKSVANIPSVIGAKVITVDGYLSWLSATGGRINFLPMDSRWYAFARLSPEQATACWSTAASMGPRPVIALRDALRKRDWAAARAITDDLTWANETLYESIPGGRASAAQWNIQLEKTRIDAAGFANAGPIRPPYHRFKDEEVAGAREVGSRWAELQRKYSAKGYEKDDEGDAGS